MNIMSFARPKPCHFLSLSYMEMLCFFQAGANMIVSGTAVIGAEDPGKVIATMRDIVEGSIQKCQLER
jgi:hypothetical protein